MIKLSERILCLSLMKNFQSLETFENYALSEIGNDSLQIFVREKIRSENSSSHQFGGERISTWLLDYTTAKAQLQLSFL